MRRIPLAFRLLAFFAIASIAAAATVGSTSLGSTTTLAVDGVLSAKVLSWEGGDLKGSVVTSPVSSGGLPTKAVAKSACAPLVVTVAFPPPAALSSWINDLCTNKFTRRTLVLTDYNAMGVAVEALEARDVMLTGVTFPAFDAATVSLGSMTLVFNAEESRPIAPVSSIAAGIVARSGAVTFRLSIDGLDASGVMGIEPITIAQHVTTEAIGAARVYTSTPSYTEFSNLRVNLSAARADTWKAWWTDFIVKGNSTDANEKGGSLTFLNSSGEPLDLALNFSHVGILRVSRPPDATGSTTKLEAELYFEGLTLGPPTVSKGSADTSSSTTSDPATSSIAGARTPLATEVPLAAPTSTRTLSPAVTAALNPADKGSRDPAQFPRVDGLTRTSYSGTYQKEYTSENAYYTSPETIYQLVARVDAAAKAAGWMLGSLDESESDNGKSVGEHWSKPQATATVDYFGPKDAASTRLQVQVYVTIPVAPKF